MKSAVLLAGLSLVASSCSGGSSAGVDVTEPSPATTASTSVPAATTVPAVTTATTVPEPAPMVTEPVVEGDPAAPDGLAPAALELELIDCERMTTATRVDADVAQAYVEPDQELATEGGQSLFSLSVLQCEDLVTDGESHGPGGFTTAWLRLADGPPPPLPADTGIDPTGTDHYRPLFFQTDNVDFAQATMNFGIPMRLAQMEFEPSVAGTQSGTVVQGWTDPSLSYRWAIENEREGSLPGNDFVHTLNGVTDEGIPLTYVGVFSHTLPGWLGNSASVEAEEGSFLSELVGAGFDAPGNGTDIDVHMAVVRHDPVNVFEQTVPDFPIAIGPGTRIRVSEPASACDGNLRPAIVGAAYLGDQFVDRGYVVVEVLLQHDAPSSLNEQMLVDIAQASQRLGVTVQWLRTHADDYCVDPDAIAVIGYSWTAVAALSLGYSSGEIGIGEAVEVDPLGDPVGMPDGPNIPVPPNLADASRVPNAAISIAGFALADTIDPGEPPALLIHGRNDTTVPFDLAVATCESAREVGVACEILEHDEGHAGSPDTVDTVSVIVDFLDRNMIDPAG